MTLKFCAFLILFHVFGFARSVSDVKSNVVLVIDNTGSMDVVIEGITEKALHMFEEIYSSGTSSIGDFILVTFNDIEFFKKGLIYENFKHEPILIRATTTNSTIFKQELEKISVGGGGTCPELCIGGIKAAIEKSSPNSYLYVFTDAAPRDQNLHESVINLAQQKSIQINFLLTTGRCPDFDIYKKIAKATSGEIFLLENENISEIIEYIIHSMRSPQTSVKTVPIQPGNTNIDFTVDKDMKNVSIKVNVNAEEDVEVQVTGPEGNKTPAIDLVNIPNTKVVIVPNPASGPYTATVDSTGAGEATIKAYISVDFEHGFSVWKPSSLKNTKTKPIPDEESYLAIRLILTGTINAKLQSIQILDIDENELMTMPADTTDEKNNIYVSSPFKPPNHFKIAIIVVDQDTGHILKRIGRTPIQYQSLPTEKLSYKTPEVTIENSPKVSVAYGESIILECIVKAYPKPNIVWEDKDTGMELPSKVSILELPEEYISHLKIDSLSKTGSYKCKATSSINEVVSASIEVETFRPKFLKVLKAPEDTKIDYEKAAKIHCEIDAWPPGLVVWYKGDKELTNDGNFDISDDKQTLEVKKMLPELEGNYFCKATNDDNSLILEFNIILSGVEPPEFDKTNPEIAVKEGSETKISCRIIKGSPTPVIAWTFKKHNANEFIILPNIEQSIELDPVKVDNAGIYKCYASNIYGDDSHEIVLNVHSKPEIDKTRSNIIVAQGTKVVIPCRIIKGIREPEISWEFQKTSARVFFSITETQQAHIIESVDIENAGTYRCRAKNIVGEDSHDTELIVQYKTEIDKTESSKTVNEGSETDIPCSVIKGFPEPEITWMFQSIDSNEFQNLVESGPVIHINTVTFHNSGVYKCLAKNLVGEDYHEFFLKVYCSPEIDQSNSKILVIQGSKAVISCRITKGIPEPEISWEFRRDGTKDFISTTETGIDINIKSVDLQNAGVYRCIATNKIGMVSHEIELTVHYPPVIDKTTKIVTAIRGASLVIACRVLRGMPEPQITWKFKRQSAVEFVSLPEIEPEIHIDVVEVDDAGVYKCYAKSTVGKDSHKIELTVHYPPKVTGNPPITVKVGETVSFSCDVTGEPKPDVRWFRDGKIIEVNEKFEIYSDHSLSFIASVDDGANYTCEAKNSISSDSKNTTLVIYGPVKIEPPEETPLIVAVGSDVELLCKASGVPKPQIAWRFFGLQPNVGSKILASTELLTINRIQASNAGNYRCVANNGYDENTITYEVLVSVPVEIEPPEQTSFTIIENDLVLMIPCKAKGYPEPKVIWTMDFMVLPMGAIYAVDPHGTLIINNPDQSLTGKYLCVADNKESYAFQMFTVNYRSIPNTREPTEILYIQEHTTTEIKCRLPYKLTDVIRWYTNGKEIILPHGRNQFILHDATVNHSGDYTCRVSSYTGSQTAHLKVHVGTRPSFVNSRDTVTIVPFIHGRQCFLDCYVTGNPMPTVTWWRNGKKLEDSSTVYTINELSESHLGENCCEAKNDLGTITRTYSIEITGCVINYTETELNRFHPVLISSSGKLAEFENKDGMMTIPENEMIDFVCPNLIREGFCSENGLFFITAESRHIEYSELKCDKEVEPCTAQHELQNQPCYFDSDSRLIQVGFEHRTSFSGLYDVCMNEMSQKQYFIKYEVTRYASNIKINSHSFVNEHMYYKYEDMYNCDIQRSLFNEGCCFLGKQLVSPQDVAPGVQKATYFNINVVPHWNFCGDNLVTNFDEVDKRIRDLAKSIRYKLEVFAGEFENQPYDLRDSHGNRKLVPKYIWKVVQVRKTRAALAIVTINIPNLTAANVIKDKLVFCPDICGDVDWMQSTQWHDVLRGYTFCCKPWTFAERFNPIFYQLLQSKRLLRKAVHE